MNNFYMMVGLPASGKSTIAKELAEEQNAEIVSSDKIRKELYGDESVKQNNNKVFEILHRRIIEGLKSGKNMIYDATNINYKTRMAFLQRISKLNVNKIAIMVATSYEECLERNENRERKVPEEVIKKIYFNFYVPQYFEGFDEIQIRYNYESINSSFFFDELKDIKQDSPHHTLSVLDHCKACEQYLINKKAKNEIKIAGRIHDIGKLKTKTFVNSKGETTEIGHFYNHEKVSAYDSLFYVDIEMRIMNEMLENEALRIIKLIQWHMLPWSNITKKIENKYKELLGEEFWNDLMILHEADKEAH